MPGWRGLTSGDTPIRTSIIGFQSILFAVFSKVYAINAGLLPEDPRLDRVFRAFRLEVGLAVGAALALLGLAASVYAVGDWGRLAFGELDPQRTLRVIIPAVLALTLGFQTLLSSFFLSVLGLGQRR